MTAWTFPDPDDDHGLAAALAGAVDMMVSGDKRDLLPLSSYQIKSNQDIRIVTAREAVERLEASSERQCVWAKLPGQVALMRAGG